MRIFSVSQMLTLAAITSCMPAAGEATHYLQGRIEQIAGQNEPRLPELKALTPKVDPRGMAPTTMKIGQATISSYPVNWQGNWTGDLKIVSARFDEPTMPALKKEIDFERRINTPGRSGHADFRFAYVNGNKIALDPVAIQFTMPSNVESPPPIAITPENASQLLAPGQSYSPGMQWVPSREYTIKMNNYASGVSAGGNMLSQFVMLNSVKTLAPKVVEQDIVTRATEELAETKALVWHYDESVLRFTMVDTHTMMVQAVSLSYDEKGRCNSTLSFSGYIFRKS